MGSENFKKLVADLNAKEIEQTKFDWAENIPEDTWEAHFKGRFTQVKSNMDVEEHRHYELSYEVIAILGGFMGIWHVSKLYSESSSVDDVCHTLKFVEMKEVKIISYEPV